MAERLFEFSDLRAYREAFTLQQAVFRWSRGLPPGERYALRDQVRRSSRAIGASVAEAWQKRRYPAHFVSKLTDADAELAETRHWLYTARSCGYISAEEHASLQERSQVVGRLLGGMIRAPARWRLRV